MTDPVCSIVLPCYNEAETIPQLVARFAEVVGPRRDLEVIFVDNGSRDASATILRRECDAPGREFCRVVSVPVNEGYGHGIWQGLQAARGDFVGWTHADSQYDPAIVVEGFARLRTAPIPQRTLVQGKRTGRGLVDRFFTAGMTVVARLLLGTDVRDINAQPKLFPRAFLADLRHPPKDFSLDLYALVIARRRGLAIVDLPVYFGPRLHGEAKGGGSLRLKWKLTRRTWAFILQLRRDLRRDSLGP